MVLWDGAVMRAWQHDWPDPLNREASLFKSGPERYCSARHHGIGGDPPGPSLRDDSKVIAIKQQMKY
eukprot:1237318-Rhodomonas_salina.1